MTLGLLLLAGASSWAAAGQRTLGIRVYDGKATYAQVVSVPYGARTTFNGRVSPPGAPARDLSVKVLALPETVRDGPSLMQYQVELSPGPGVEGRVLQAQGELSLRPGSVVKAVQCGAWTLELDLDDGAPRVRPEGFGAEDGNLRVSLDLRGGSVVCRQVLKARSQGSVIDGLLSGGRKSGVVMNLSAAPAPEGVALDYQFAFDPIGVSGVTIQRKAVLPFGRVQSLAGYHLDLLAEGFSSPTL